MTQANSTPPSALLLIATGCQHCPSVLQSLSELIKEGKLASLEVVNIVSAPERAQALNVRSVPWVKIGEFELVGMKSKSELQQWIDKSSQSADASSDKAIDMVDYFEELLSNGELDKVQQLVESKPQTMQGLFDIMQNDQSSLSARLGVAAVIESLAGSNLLIQQVGALGNYCKDKNPRVRNDACYYLGLTHHNSARRYIEPLLQDDNAEVRETAEDALVELQS